jgi:hypothetical protein
MSTDQRPMSVLRNCGVFALLVAALLGCASSAGERDAKISEKYPVPEKASAECVSAAKRASRWCVSDRNIITDPLYSGQCHSAQWDYARSCH